jgi:hypothetical protein
MKKALLFVFMIAALGVAMRTRGIQKVHADSGPVTFGGRPLIPRWGIGTLLRANDADPVYVLDRNVRYRHLLDPGWFSTCHTGTDKIIWVFSQALHSPTLQQGPDLGSGCVDRTNSSVGGFQELFEPGSNGSRHIGMTAWTDADGRRMQGIIRYESDTVLKGVCGGAVVVLVEASGHILQYYTPPTGCGNGKIAGHAEQRFVGWEDDIPESARGKIAQVRVGVIFTQGRPLNGVWEAVGTINDVIKTVADAARAVGIRL